MAADRTTDGSAAAPLRVQLAAGAPIDAARLADVLSAAGYVPLFSRAEPGAAEAEWDITLAAPPAEAAEIPPNLIALPIAEPQRHAPYETAPQEVRPAAGGELPSPPLETGNRRSLRARAPGAALQSDPGAFRPPRSLPVAAHRDRSHRRGRVADYADDELAVVYAALSCGAALLDEDGRVRFANAALHAMLGVTGDAPDALQRTLKRLRVYDAQGEPVLPDAWATAVALRTGRPVQGKVVAVDRPDGVRRWLQIDAVPLPARGGGPRRVAATFIDITASYAERDRALRLASIVENCSDAVAGTDLDGLVCIWNPAAERLYGYTAAEMLGQPITRVMLPEEAASFPERLRRIGAGERLTNRETLRRRKDGSTVPISVSSSPVYDAAGRVVGAAGAARDMTLRKSHEARLLRLAAIIESADDAVLAFGRDLRIDICNPAAARLFGHGVEQLGGRSLDWLLPPGRHPDLPAIVARVLDGEPIPPREARYRRPDGQEIQIAFSINPLRDAAGAVAGGALVARDVTAQKAAEAALRSSEERYRTLFENAKDVVVTIDRDGRVTSVNRAGELLAGIPRAQIVGRHLTELLQPDSFEQAAERNRRREAGDRVVDRVHEVRTLDGRTIPLEVSSSVIYEDGRPAGMLGIARDISERRLAEAALRESEARKSVMLETALDCVIAIDAAGCILEFNPAAERTFGYRRDEALGQELAELIVPPQLRDRHRAGLRRYLESGQGTVIGTRIRTTAMRRDGSEFPVELAISAIETAGGASFTAFIRDIGEQQQAEAALRESEARYRTLFENARDVIYTLDMEFNFTSINRAGELLTGMPREQILGKNIALFLPQEDPRPLIERRRRREAGEKLGDSLHEIRTPDGRSIPLEVSTDLIFHEGRPIGVQGIARDVSERRRAEAEQRQRAERLLALHELTLQVAAGTDTGNLLERILGAATQLTGAPAATLYLWDAEAELLRPVLSRNVPERDATPPVRASEGLSGATWASGEATIVNDYPAWQGAMASGRVGGLLAGLAVPLQTGGRRLGVLMVRRYEPGAPFSDEDAHLLTLLAGLVTQLLVRDWQDAALREKAERLLTLHELALDVAAGAETSDLLERIVSAAMRLCNAPAATLCVWDEPRGLLQPALNRNVPAHELPPALRPGQGAAGLAWERGAAVIVNDYPRWPNAVAAGLIGGLQAALAVPLQAGGRKLGALLIRRYEPGVPFSDEDAQLLELLGGLAAQLMLRDQNDAALRDSERRFRAVFESVGLGVARCDLGGRILESNGALQAMLGYAAEELAQRSFRDLTFAEDLSTPLEALGRVLAGEPDRYELEKRYVRKDGSLFWAHLIVSLVRDAGGVPQFTICTVEDISSRKETEQALKHQALHDGLTGLPNRTMLRDRLQQAILHAERRQQRFALLFLDLDRFKEVNDTFGHQSGDRLLQQAGPRLQSVLRTSDTVARLGGDEFAVLLPDTGDDGAQVAARALAAVLEQPFDLGEHCVSVGASIGIALYPEHGDDDGALMRHADVAMYQAKQRGSGIALYSAERDGHDPVRLTLLGELRQAFERHELQLHYQPVVRLNDGWPAHVEALLRWRHPARGLVPPDEFIPLAEQTGLIAPLTHWTLHEALRQVRSWQDRDLYLGVAVNLSARMLHEPHLAETVAALLREHGVPARRLKLELTESAIMVDPAGALAVLGELHAMGVRLSIDDFGTGYSSLAYLKHLPVDEIKIDKSFVQDMTLSGKDLAIVRSTVELARNLGLQVVAEGIEDGETWQRLVALGCDLAQGYHVSRPLPAGDLESWLSAHGYDRW